MSQRLEWLDFARGASILLVVMFHATIALDAEGSVSGLYWFSNNLFGPIRMPVFFVASGFLARNLIQKSWQDVLSGRVALLVYLFTVWTVIHFGFSALGPIGQDARLVSLLTSFYSPSSVLWFIWALAFYVVVAKAGLSASPGLVMGVSVLMSVAVHSGYISFESYVYANVLEFLPFFLFGAWFSSAVVRSHVFRSYPYVLLSLALYAVLFVALYEQLVPLGLNGLMSFLLETLGINVGICVSILACRSATLARVPLYLGRNTLAVYVAHYPIVQLLSLTRPLAGGAFRLEQVWAVPVVTIVAVALSLLLKVVADRLGGGWLYALPAPGRPPARTAAKMEQTEQWR